MRLLGLHHVTAIASDPKRNIAFYTQVLGLRLVKKTVNFDDPGTYHLYYGGPAATPGTLLTFFLWGDLPRGHAGNGMTGAVAYAVPATSLDFWRARLRSKGVTVTEAPRLGESALAFTDPDGLALEIVGSAEGDPREPAHHADVPAAHGIRGFHSVTLLAGTGEQTAWVLTEEMGYRLLAQDGARARYTPEAGGPGTIVDLLLDPKQPRGRSGAGTVHHVAFRTPDDAAQRQAHAELTERGFGVSPIMDRCYFHSIYYREPNGVLFEIATDGPGFTVDEPLDQLGGSLQLPPWHEANRAAIEAALPPLV